MCTLQPLFIGTTELVLIGGIALLLFGGKKLPEMMRGLGQGVKEFKDGLNEVKAPADEDCGAGDGGSVPAGETAGTSAEGTEAPEAGGEHKDAAHE